MIVAANRCYLAGRVYLASSFVEAAAGVAEYLTWDNYDAELQTIYEANSRYGADADDYDAYAAWTSWIFFDASAYGLADVEALNAALTAGNVLDIADAETYAASYTP